MIRVIVPLCLLLPDETSLARVEEALAEAQMTLAICGIISHVGRIQWPSAHRPPRINCVPPRGIAS